MSVSDEITEASLTEEELQERLKSINDQLFFSNHFQRPELEKKASELTEKLKRIQQTRIEQSQPLPVCKNESAVPFLQNFPIVQIDEGKQKYVLIRVPKDLNLVELDMYFVRGNRHAEYHYQCALNTMNDLEVNGVHAEVAGGGRIECRGNEKEVEIYGHSYQYGKADHSITAKLLKDHLGDDYQVSFGDYGY